MSHDIIIPLKVRVGIRDQWESPKAPIRHSIEALTTTLGHQITPEVEWPTLYGALKSAFPEPNAFVPAICRIAIAFYGRLLARLENENNTIWTETFLEAMSTAANWKLRMEVPVNEALQRPHLVWNTDTGNFCIQVPMRKPAGNAVIEAGFDEDLDNFFGDAAHLQGTPVAQTGKVVPELPKEENWIEVETVDTQGEPEQETPPQELSAPSTAAVQEKAKKVRHMLPIVDVLARPTKLFQQNSPYVLLVNAETTPLRVQCSHPATLEYIASYLKKWGRVLDQNSPSQRPLLKIEMIESVFFSGVIDTISIELSYARGDTQPLNPAMILGFVEGVLGYKEVFTNGARWTFKLDPGDAHQWST